MSQCLSYSEHVFNFAEKLSFSELQPYFFEQLFSPIGDINCKSLRKTESHVGESKSKHSHSVRPQFRRKVDTFETLGLVRWEESLGHFLTTFWPLSGHFSVTSRSLLGHFLVTSGHFWSLSGHSSTTFRLLFGHYRPRGRFHILTYYSLFPTPPLACNLLIAFQTLFGAPALSSLAIQLIDIDVCFRSSAANSIFSGSPFLRALSSSSSTFLFPKNSAITHVDFSSIVSATASPS